MDFYTLNNFEKELVYFKTRVETIISLEMGIKLLWKMPTRKLGD